MAVHRCQKGWYEYLLRWANWFGAAKMFNATFVQHYLSPCQVLLHVGLTNSGLICGISELSRESYGWFSCAAVLTQAVYNEAAAAIRLYYVRYILLETELVCGYPRLLLFFVRAYLGISLADACSNTYQNVI